MNSPNLSSSEQHKLLVEFNDTARNYPHDHCVHQLFEQQVERTPDAIAVIFADKHLTYRQLNTRANQLAHYLQQLGVTPDTLIGLCIDRSLAMVIGLLGILKAGGAYVPLDPTYPTERLAYMVQDAQLLIVLTQPHLVEKLPATNINLICLEQEQTRLENESSENPVTGVKPHHLVYVIYTSGSTGKPKGVMIEHSSLSNLVAMETTTWAITSRDRVLQFNSISFDVTAKELYPALSMGATLILRTQEILSLSSFVQKCQEWQLTIIILTSAFWHQLSAELARTGKSLPASLRLVFVGGERVLPQKVELWHKSIQSMVQSQSPEIAPQLINCYGPTEATVFTTFYNLSSAEAKRQLPMISIGRPIANTQTYILDVNLQPVPIGEAGELHIGGVGLARGYLNRPDLTHEKFIPNPFQPSQRLYKTGDLARYQADGNIEFLGRIDHQVKIRGFRIELGEIETALEHHATIQQAIVLAQEDKFGDNRLVAYVVPHPVDEDNPLETQNWQLAVEWRDFLQDKLPEYMVPTAFKLLAALPLTPGGKVDRQALAMLAVDNYSLAAKSHPSTPRTPLESLLVQAWMEVLDVEGIGIHDNFFELGGNSLKIIVLLNRLEEHIDRTISIVDLFNAPTIAEFAAYLEKSTSDLALFKPDSQVSQSHTNSGTISDANIETHHFPTTFLQERFWTYRQLGSFYHLPNYFYLTGLLNRAVLEQSLNEIIRRHAILRTTLKEVDGDLIQVAAPVGNVLMSVIDLNTLPQSEQSLEVDRLLKQEVQRQAMLEHDPWLRVTLICLATDSHILLIGLHILIADERSTELFLWELGKLYTAFLANNSSPLPELLIQYGDYAQWQRQSLTEVLFARLDYWKNWLSQEPPPLNLPIDFPLPAVQTFQATMVKDLLSSALTQGLYTVSQQHQVTLFTTVLTAFTILLAHWCECEEMVIVAPHTNRSHSQFQSLMGDFGGMLAFRIEVVKNLTLSELLLQVRQEVVNTIANQDIPLEQVAKIQPTLQRQKPFSKVYLDFLLGSPPEELQLADLTVVSVPLEAIMMRLALGLVVWEQPTPAGTCLQLQWRYKKELFAPETIAQIAADFRMLLTTITTAPKTLVRELATISGLHQPNHRS